MKKILVLGLVLALALTLLLPSMAMAAPAVKSFSAAATMTIIDIGDVRPVGDSGNWVVRNRHISGTFLPGSDLSGDYTLTYGGVFNIVDQSGNLTGELVTDLAKCKVTGNAPGLTPICIPYKDLDDESIYLVDCNMQVTGHWVGSDNLCGNGNFTADLTLIVYFSGPNAGHVKAIDPLRCQFCMTGKFAGNNK